MFLGLCPGLGAEQHGGFFATLIPTWMLQERPSAVCFTAHPAMRRSRVLVHAGAQSKRGWPLGIAGTSYLYFY
ncbi:hypothetical protein AV530_019691 [Patagioenas fasciata monilis]|uniref:Uncharacterized protein n=1 Tax=Patagioenas fasciata monilis TaxID=372326 RepID=A0A1V4JE89_PATFA|nr:hypothetical protein AV530_019691 [Patagioenas fasciata monilis]